jgi:hypothetical protein
LFLPQRLSLRHDPTLDDTNIVQKLQSIGSLDQILCFDVSWTGVSPTGLGKALPLMPNLLELFYESPLLLKDFPISQLPGSVISVHLHRECTQFGGKFEDIYDSAASERLKNLWKRSQCGPVDLDNPKQGYIYHGCWDPASAADVIEDIKAQGSALELVHFDTSSRSKGLWSADDAERAVNALPASVKRLQLTALQHSASTNGKVIFECKI